jgi:hypothetical protein
MEVQMGMPVCSFESCWRMAVVGMHEALLLPGFGIWSHVSILNPIHFIVRNKEIRTDTLGSGLDIPGEGG